MKKDEKTEKENTARSSSEEKNSPEGWKRGKERTIYLSFVTILIIVNLLQRIFLKRIIILFGFLVKKFYFTFCLIVGDRSCWFWLCVP